MIQLGNPLPALLGLLLMGLFCGMLSRHVAVLDVSAAHAKTLPLDGLRGLLASAVFLQHGYITYRYFSNGNWDAPASNFYAQLGQSAVTMFFFISGFLFWRKMLKDPASVRASILLPNRARRILPAYLAAMVLLFSLVAVRSHLQLRQSAASMAEQTISWLLAGFPYLSSPPINGIATRPLTGGIFWTLQLEWIFYLVLPLLAWCRPIRIFLLSMPLWLGATILLKHTHVAQPFLDEIRSTLETFTHMFWAGFAIGMLAAYGNRNERTHRILRSAWMTPVAAILLALQLFLVPPDYAYYEPVLLAPIFFMIVAGNSFLGILSSRPLRALGAVSYSLYVLHGLLLHLLATLLNSVHPIPTLSPLVYWGCILLIGLVVSLCATLSYRFIEKPFFAERRA